MRAASSANMCGVVTACPPQMHIRTPALHKSSGPFALWPFGCTQEPCAAHVSGAKPPPAHAPSARPATPCLPHQPSRGQAQGASHMRPPAIPKIKWTVIEVRHATHIPPPCPAAAACSSHCACSLNAEPCMHHHTRTFVRIQAPRAACSHTVPLTLGAAPHAATVC